MPERDKVLITGSSGMLGVDLWKELSSEFELWGLDIATSNQKVESRKKLITCDICDRVETIKAISAVKPDVVIHTAAWTDVDGCELDKKKAYKINYKGTRNVALGCRRANSTLIYISTDFVFDGKKKRPYKESDKTNSLSVYGDSKLKGEEAIKKILKRHFILRTSWLYGKNGKNFVDTILKKAKDKKALKVVDDQIGSPTYTKDLAGAIHRLLDKVFVHRTSYIVPRLRSGQALSLSKGVHRYGIYHISNSGSVSWYGYAKKILNIAGSNTKVLPISSTELDRPARRPAMSVLDNSKFIKFSAFEMRNWQKALKDYLLRGARC